MADVFTRRSQVACASELRGARRAVVRDLRRGAVRPEDHTIWLENPACSVLERRFAEL